MGEEDTFQYIDLSIGSQGEDMMCGGVLNVILISVNTSF
jgi:hypothetical protein